MTIVYVTDMDRSLDWYRAAVPDARLLSTSQFWSEFETSGGTFALHAAGSVERGSQVGLSFVADRPLEDIVARWAQSHIAPSRDIADEPFGRSVVVIDPDGLAIQVNEHRSEPHT